MIVNVQDIIDSVDLTRNEVLLPIYESVVNSIISLMKTDNLDKKVNVFIERNTPQTPTLDFDTNGVETIQNVIIVDNGEGFTEANFKSFQQPFSKYNKKYGCKGVGRFTILALFEKMEVVSIYKEQESWYKRSFSFDASTELIDYNLHNGWRKSPFGSYYKIIAEQNLHIEAITYQNLLHNAKERNNPFFDQLFADNAED